MQETNSLCVLETQISEFSCQIEGLDSTCDIVLQLVELDFELFDYFFDFSLELVPRNPAPQHLEHSFSAYLLLFFSLELIPFLFDPDKEGEVLLEQFHRCVKLFVFQIFGKLDVFIVGSILA